MKDPVHHCRALLDLERIAGSQEHTFGDLPGGVASVRRFVEEAVLAKLCAFASQRLKPAERMDRCRAQHRSRRRHRLALRLRRQLNRSTTPNCIAARAAGAAPIMRGEPGHAKVAVLWAQVGLDELGLRERTS